MTRRKKKQLDLRASASRTTRIEKLIAKGWISSAHEIPWNAIPVDPDRINLGGSYHHPTHFQAIQFTCVDCGAEQVWAAEDQQWYYETTGAPFYYRAIRCRPCRREEKKRKDQARNAWEKGIQPNP